MNEKLSPLDQDIASLLQNEREQPGAVPDQNARGRVAGRLAATLGIPLVVPGGPFSPDGSPAADGPPADPSSADPTSGMDPSAGVDPSAGLDPTGLDPSALLDPSLADPTALAAAGKAVAGAAAGKAAGAVAGASTASAGAVAGSGAAAGAAVASTAAGATAGAAAGATAGAAAGAGTSAAAGAGVMALITKPLLLGTFVAGTMVGGGTVAVVQPAIAPAPKPKIVYVPQPVASNLNEAAFADDDELEAEAAVASEDGFEDGADEAPKVKVSKRKKRPRKVAKAPAPPPVEKTSKAERDAALAKENALVQMARTSLQRQKHVQALKALREHKRTFPAGKLTEEREALTIFSLIGLGEVDAAKAAARRFGVRYPKSIFANSVKQALRGR